MIDNSPRVEQGLHPHGRDTEQYRFTRGRRGEPPQWLSTEGPRVTPVGKAT